MNRITTAASRSGGVRSFFRRLLSPSPAAKPPLWLLVLITLSGTMAMHMFVPALPAAAHALDSGAGAMQMAISIYIIGLALGQLLYGPLSDAIGRRPMLMTGLALYIAGGITCALAPGVGTLLAGRLLQALGGCAGLALGRAMVRDTTSAESAVRALALLNVMMLVGPGAAPMVGGALASAVGWRSIFVLLAAFGAFTAACAWRLLPETAQPSRRFGPKHLVGDYRALLGSRRFLGLAIGGGCATTSIYAFLSAAPFIFTNELHQPVQKVGLLTGVLVLGMATGSALSGRLARPVGTERLLRIGSLLSLASAAVLLAIALSGALTVFNTVGLMLLFTCGCGMTSPAALARIMSIDAQRVGSAAGLYGFSQMTVGAVCTTLAALGQNPAVSAVTVLVGATVISQIAFFWADRQHA